MKAEEIHKKNYHLVYKTRTTPFFPICLIGISYSFSSDYFQHFQWKPQSIVAIIKKGTVHWYFPKSFSLRAHDFFKEVISSRKYFDALIKEEKLLAHKIKQLKKTSPYQLFKKRKLTKEGESHLRKLFTMYISYGHLIDVPGFLFQVYMMDTLKEHFFQDIKGPEEKKLQWFHLLLSSPKKTSYEEFLFSLDLWIRGKKTRKEIEEKYSWVVYDYLGEVIDKKYLLQKKQEITKDLKGFRKQLKETHQRIKTMKEFFLRLPKKKREKYQRIQTLLYYYNEKKKKLLNPINMYLRDVLVQRYPKLSYDKIHTYYQLTPEEFIRILKGEHLKDLNAKEHQWVYVIENGKIRTPNKKTWKNYFSLVENKKRITLLKGQGVSPGRVKGKVNIVLNISHIYKFKSGDILVAPFTNVNYLPIMYQAKAILTETGGLTSHAAIVSRELKKPGIVGIPNLLSSLNDGDVVEVDGKKGIIKILKKGR